MSDNSASQEYSTSRVPLDATVSGWQIALIELGIFIALPAFITGVQIGFQLGLGYGALAIVLGACILAVLAFLTGIVARKSRLTTAMIIRQAFGQQGARLVNFILALTMFGWFGVTAELFGHSIASMARESGLPEIDPRIYMVIGGVLMIVTTIIGIRAIQKLADVAVPFMLLGLVAAAVLATQSVPLETLFASPDVITGFGLSVSAVVGGIAAGAVVFPDLGRFARTKKDTGIAAWVSFAVGVPVVLLLAAVPSIATGERDLMTILTTLGLGIPALLLLVIIAWTTNSGNLYSSALFLAGIFGRGSHALLSGLAGTAGILIAVFQITDHFIPFLIILGIAIPPIAGIYIADFFFLRQEKYMSDADVDPPAFIYSAFVAWAAGIAVASVAAADKITLTAIPACDAVIAAFLVRMLIGKLAARKAAASPT